MLVSTRGRYALRVMVDLAQHQSQGPIPMKDVAQRQQISLKYLEKILPVYLQLILGKILIQVHKLAQHINAVGIFRIRGKQIGHGVSSQPSAG